MTGRLLLLALLPLLPLASSASAQDPLAPRSSPDVELVRNIPMQHFPNGGRLVGRHFYVTTGRDLTIFDVSTPEAPVPVGHMYFGEGGPWNQLDGTYLTGYEEDVDTNGRILLRADDPMLVVDVSDPRAPKTIATLSGVGQHTISCLLDCTWAYGSEGAIIDLRDPRNPVAAGNWLDQMPGDPFGHDVTEVAPGMVLTATDPMFLLDAREDPMSPEVLATTDALGFVHGTQWPNRMGDRFALAGGEVGGPGCGDSEAATLQSWDTSGWERTGRFVLAGRYGVTPGTIDDGRHVESRYCGHWFDPHPNFRDGGPVAMGWYEHGTRFVQVGRDGGLEEVGWFLRPDGWAWAAYWITDRIVYVTDHHKGIDVLRFNGPIPERPGAAGPQVPARDSVAPPPRVEPPRRPRLQDFVSLPPSNRCAGRRGFALRVRNPAALRRLTAKAGRRRPVAASGVALRRPLRLRSLPRRRFTLAVAATTVGGDRLTLRRSYRPCRSKAPRRPRRIA